MRNKLGNQKSSSLHENVDERKAPQLVNKIDLSRFSNPCFSATASLISFNNVLIDSFTLTSELYFFRYFGKNLRDRKIQGFLIKLIFLDIATHTSP